MRDVRCEASNLERPALTRFVFFEGFGVIDKLEAKKLLMKTKLYKLFALAFLIVGFLVFVVLYDQSAQGNFLVLLKDPLLIFVLIMPFIPAAVLSIMAGKLEGRLALFFDEYKSSDKQKPK